MRGRVHFLAGATHVESRTTLCLPKGRAVGRYVDGFVVTADEARVTCRRCRRALAWAATLEARVADLLVDDDPKGER